MKRRAFFTFIAAAPLAAVAKVVAAQPTPVVRLMDNAVLKNCRLEGGITVMWVEGASNCRIEGNIIT